MKIKFRNLKSTLFSGACAIALLSSCSNNDSNEDIAPTLPVTKDFQMVFASGSGSISGTYLQGVTDLSKGEVSFSGKGYSMTSSRTARVFTSTDGSIVYSLNYTVGTIDKLTYHGGQNYKMVTTIDASIPLGVKAVRFTKMNDKVGSVHSIAAIPLYAGANNTEYLKHKMTVTIGLLDLEAMSIGNNFKKDIDLVLPGTLASEGYYISRIDCPVISGNKLYYGASVSKFNTATGKGGETDKTFTLVLDYPSLTNATVISTSHVKGATNGYRTPTQHFNEAGEIMQMVSNGKDLNIVKIKDGKYDESYKLSVSELLGKPASSNGWFYAGNGIGYIPYEKLDQDKIQIGVDSNGEKSYSAPWGLARIDFKNNTVLDLNVPKGLWLQQYQNSVVRDGKFYIALTPVGVEGNIYIFDVNSTSPDGTVGAKVTSGADQYYIGIF
ncbi:hypothetical protein OIU80_16440 [Flavobacterium sp. LS1R47]|jgi:hypothetical protein|uniref:DUF4374 domain-containing protein n=1 Tax=Flavobacterium frigoritolerans TaxID=2987686 RepID=A0A9X3C946_9FLAO|nr:hypothetical protein [Flavobacterium frigoritolerans]MCV9933872.1 hypothetical protein [Flavobacterium frigoritolerans]